MSNQHAWEQVRAKNPIVKRNAWVTHKGQPYRVAGLTSEGDVILRHEKTVNPSGIKTMGDNAVTGICSEISANEARMERIRERLKVDPDDSLLMKELAMVSGIIQGLYAALRHMGIELAA